MIVVINYSDERFEKAREYNSKTAIEIGGADRIIEYSPDNLPPEYTEKFSFMKTRNERIAGRFGLWRPYIVLDALNTMNEGDFLCYCDAGLYFIRSISILVECMKKAKKNIMVFGLPFLEKQWTKGDVFSYFGAYSEDILETPQIMSTIFLVKKNKETIKFFERYKRAADEAPEIFTDEPNRNEIKNDPSFIENRHNQSVLSVLSKIESVEVFRDPSEYGIKPKLYKYLVPNAIFVQHIYSNSEYPQIIVHHRSKEIRKDVFLFARIRQLFPPYIAAKLFQVGHYIKYMFQDSKWG